MRSDGGIPGPSPHSLRLRHHGRQRAQDVSVVRGGVGRHDRRDEDLIAPKHGQPAGSRRGVEARLPEE